MSSESKINEINEHFKLPIYYNENKIELNKNIINDLELITTVDTSSNPLYNFCFDNDNDISKKINEQIVKYYTTDTNFLKENQLLLKEYCPLGVKYTDYSTNYKKIIDIWNELKIDSGFKERYYFIEWEILEFLNRTEWFLQFMSIYNLMSPVISLLIPIIILIIPFFVIKVKGLQISISEYIEILKIVANQNAIGKLFVVNFNEITNQEKSYIFISAAFYLFSIYQNFMICVRFNNNMKTIHNHFNELKIYLEHTVNSMENYLKYSHKLNSHSLFNLSVKEKMNILQQIQNKITTITEYNMFNISKIKEIGYVLKCFYELHTDKIFDNTIMFSLGFNGYMDCLKGLQKNLMERKINYAEFIDDSRKIVFQNSYYACLKDLNPVKNTIKFKKNIIITGPNASGKTTVLKSTIINILFTQQFGCGFNDSAKIKPFKYLHCYLNIPDTSGRDSLFQAEARRCKEILDIIDKNKNDKHFCSFDELYSGTNPEEAEQSAISFMKYITKNKNVFCILTTHFTKICKKLEKHKSLINYKMLTDKNQDKLEYKYILEKGISNIKGGIIVLKQMNYPKEIIDNTI
jgi:ABC-type multidrug transport system fused ATPase/permease subunit